MNVLDWVVACSVVLASIGVLAVGFVMLADWTYYRRVRVMEQLDRSRQAFMDADPMTIRIGTPLYDWEQEATS